MKMVAAICPLCQKPVVLGPAFECRPVDQDEATFTAHLQTHTSFEWVMTVQELRDQLERIEQYEQLRRHPTWAMPRA